MPKSKRIELQVAENLHRVNPENLQLLNKYKVDMTIRDLAQGTQYQYLTDLKMWFVWIVDNQNNRSVLELEDDDITEWLYFCKSQGNNTARITFRISAISSFYKFLRKKKYISTNPTEFIEAPKKHVAVIVQTYLTPEQVAIMREKLIAHGDLQLRLYATLSLSTMARVGAIASLRWSQVDPRTCTIHDVLEKENKVVDLFFNDEVKCLLQQLKGDRELKHQDDKGWIFYTGRCTETKHITVGTLRDWARKIGSMIGVETLHPHDFRHSGATLLKNAGMQLEDVAALLNHESSTTTKKYYIKRDISNTATLKRHFNL